MKEKAVILEEYDMEFYCPYCGYIIDVDMESGDIVELTCPGCKTLVAVSMV